MSGEIVYRAAEGGDNLTLNGSSDIVASLGNLSWNKLRIGIRARLYAEADISGSPAPLLAVGLCHGTAYPFRSPACQHFVGGMTNVTLFDYIPGNGISTPYWIRAGNSNNSFQACKKIGGGFTSVTSSAVGPGFAIEGLNSPKSVVMVDITKGSPTWTVDFFIFNSVAPDFSWPDLSETDFNNLMVADTPSQALHGLYTGYPLVVSEGTHGVLDTVNLSWNRTATQFNIFDFAVAKFLLD